MKLVDLIIEDLPAKGGPDYVLFGFSRRRRDGKNKKFCYIAVDEITNPQHERFGFFGIHAWWLEGKDRHLFFKSRKIAIERAQRLLAGMKGEYLHGDREWWTSKKQGIENQ